MVPHRRDAGAAYRKVAGQVAGGQNRRERWHGKDEGKGQKAKRRSGVDNER